MNEALSALFLGGLALLGGALLVVPAFLEWLRPKDADPLAIDASYSRRDTHFAERFRLMATPWWDGQGPARTARTLAVAAGDDLDETLLGGQVVCGPGARLRQEAWARERLELGEGCTARAVLSDGSLVMARGCTVGRWAHAVRELEIGPGCEVGARATCEDTLRLGEGCRTSLLAAPNILWDGKVVPMPSEIPTHARRWLRRRRIPEVGKAFDVPRRRVDLDGTTFVRGDLILDAEADVDFPLVVWGSLYLRKGALVAGDIKAHGDLLVEGSVVVGNLSCKGRLMVGFGSTIQGCLRGDTSVWLGDQVVVGRPNRPEAVVGEQVFLSGSGIVHGRIRALAGWIEVQA